MWRNVVLCWLALLLLGILSLDRATAQTQPTDKKTSTLQEMRWRDDQPPAPAQQPPSSSGRVHVFEYVLAIAGTLLVLIVVCTPSRKR